MKILKTSGTLLFIAITLLMTNCKDDDDGNNNVPEESTVTATVNGSSWESSADGPHSPVGAVGVMNTNLNVLIQAYEEDGSYITLNIASTSALTETTYSSSNGFFQPQYKADFNSNDSWPAVPLGSGSVTFTNLTNDNATGTFNFIGVHPGTNDSVIVQNGMFDVELQ